MARGITTDLIDGAKEMVSELCTAWAPTLPDLAHADVRLEVTESKVAGVENGEPKFASDDYAFAFGVRVLAGRRAGAMSEPEGPRTRGKRPAEGRGRVRPGSGR